MAGHSHWAGIKHKKALIDNKRGKLWGKLSKLIIVAAKTGGGDPTQNLRLRYAIDDAKAANMPNDTIDRAVKKGTGDLDSDNYEEIVYEGYGPGGVAVMCEILTDKRTRTAPEIRKIFEMADGKMGATNCVAWIFDRRGLVIVPAAGQDEDALMELALENGASDFKKAGNAFEIICEMSEFEGLKAALTDAKIPMDSAQLTCIPSNTVDVDGETGRKVIKLLEILDDHDDVQQVYANFSMPEEALSDAE
ncbi:MAG: YebC/PmpR family DNA-binding transcriptional regulator [Pirellulales bacterium]|nr:YebC/PmpR family DNA-binding transcriptional regulator [Pirellulales bacterium]